MQRTSSYTSVHAHTQTFSQARGKCGTFPLGKLLGAQLGVLGTGPWPYSCTCCPQDKHDAPLGTGRGAPKTTLGGTEGTLGPFPPTTAPSLPSLALPR